MLSYQIDLHHPAPATLVAGRRVLYLDSSIWIRLARHRPEEAARASDQARALVRQGRLICPLSWPLISELRHHTWESALPIARYMDELSLGLAYANETELFAAEIRNFVTGLMRGKPMPIQHQDLYASVIGAVSTNARIVWPASFPAPPEARRELTEVMEVRARAMTLASLVNGSRQDFRRTNQHTDEDLGYQRAWSERFSFARGDRSVMRRLEQECQIRDVLLPQLKKITDQLPLPTRLTILERLAALPRDKFEGAATAILEQLPGLRTKVEILAVIGFNPSRKGTLNDFYDAEIMIAPLAYADAFAAHDKWIKQLLTKESKILQTNRIRYLEDVPSLLDYLQELKC